MVGQWLQQDNANNNSNFPAGFEFRADGTYAALGKDGQPLATGGGRWEIVRVLQIVDADRMAGADSPSFWGSAGGGHSDQLP